MPKPIICSCYVLDFSSRLTLVFEKKSTRCGCFDVSECEQLYLCLCVCACQRGHSTLKWLKYFHLQALRCSRRTEEGRGEDKERHFTHDEHFETDLLFTSCPVCTLPRVELLGFLTLHKNCPLCSTVSNNSPKGQAHTAISFSKREPISAFRGNVFFFSGMEEFWPGLARVTNRACLREFKKCWGQVMQIIKQEVLAQPFASLTTFEVCSKTVFS